MGLADLQPHIKLIIDKPDVEAASSFGPGIADLCRGVRETGSLNAAAKRMGMAYSKAWRIIKETEAATDMQLLIRDGARGSSLTPEGNTLLNTYDDLKRQVQSYSEQTFDQLIDSARSR